MAKAKTESFIIELKLKTNTYNSHILEKRFKTAEHIYNTLLKYSKKQLKRMRENKAYKETLNLYLKNKSLETTTKDKLKLKEIKANIKLYSSILNDIRKAYSLTEYGLHSFVKTQQKMYSKHIDSFTAQKIATTVYKSLETVLLKKGKKLHFKKFGQLFSLEGKTNSTGIRFNKENMLLTWNKLNIKTKFRENDLFLKEALEQRIKYCRIIKKPFKNGFKYFLQLVMEGLPPAKRINATGDFRHSETPNKPVGIDIGTSTIAVVSENKLLLQELAPNSTKYNKMIERLQRKIERSKRAMNPLNFNPDGTIKRGIKLKWVHSKNYIKLIFKLKNLYRLKANLIKLEHNKLSNLVLSFGNKIYVETMRFNALQKRAKETTINKKGRFNKKKRFGKSLNNKAPSMLLGIIDRKLKYKNLKLNKVNTISFKASQYNHFEDIYIKKKLNKRWSIINKEYIQRDLYSAFLIMNSCENLKTTDRSLCLLTYNNFKNLHHLLIEEMKNDKIKYPSSFGIKKII